VRLVLDRSVGPSLAAFAATLLLASSAAAAESPGAVHPELWPAGAHGLLIRPEVEQFVDSLLAQMSLEDKIGQMTQADIESVTPGDVAKYHLGSILAGGNAAPQSNPRTTPGAWLELSEAFHRAALTPVAGHAPIPIIFGVDAVHGHAKIIGATIFPHNVGLGAAHDPELMRRIGQATAEEVSATGIDWTFAPTVAVVRDVRWGRSYESYSEDPELVASYAAAVVSGLQGRIGSREFLSPGHTVSSIKHYLGDGGTRDGRDQGANESSEPELVRVHAAGYPAAINAGALIVMASYNSWQGVKMHANAGLLTEVLKNRLGFGGFLVGDWNAQEEIPGCTKYSCAATALAGLDMYMAPDSWREIYRNTLEQARAGTIPMARIDDAVRRILRVKALAGLFERPLPSKRDAGHFDRLGSPAHRAIAREAVRKSLVLLKNAKHLLPLDPRQRILVAGDAADDLGRQMGGWTIDWQGDHNTAADFPGATSILAGLRAAVASAGGHLDYAPDGHYREKPDAAVVVFGEGPYAEFEGDRETLEFSPGDDHALKLLKYLQGRHIPVIAVFLSGRPLWVNREINASDAFVAAWLPGAEGAGVADLLLRAPEGSARYDFTGRSSFSWPATAMPVSFSGDRPSGALFPRGAGLALADDGALARLPEDPHAPADRLGEDWLFGRAHVVAPWSIFLDDTLAEVRLTTPSQLSPAGSILVSLSGEGATAEWVGGESELRIGGRPTDLRARRSRGESLEIRWRVDARPSSTVSVGLRCAGSYGASPSPAVPGGAALDVAALCGTKSGALVDLSSELSRAPLGQFHTTVVPLACFARKGADLANVKAPFAIVTDGNFKITLGAIRYTRADGNCGA
jgi:beta-glucosidase